MPITRKFDFSYDYSNARPAEMPRPRGGDSKERAKAMSKAGKRIALGEEALSLIHI